MILRFKIEPYLGEEYFGKWDRTESGKTCENWNLHGRVYYEEHNYCRNPLNEQKPWCYISEFEYEGTDFKTIIQFKEFFTQKVGGFWP